jgi:hypothetical protein
MGTRAPESAGDTYRFKQLAKDLRTATSGDGFLKCLQTTSTAIEDALVARNAVGPCAFVQAGGLDSVIRVITGARTSEAVNNADSLSSEIACEAGQILGMISKAKLVNFAGCASPSWTKVLRDAPHCIARLASTHPLKGIAELDPAERRRMAEAGTMALLLAFFTEVGTSDNDKEMMAPAWGLARLLLRWEPAAIKDLQRAICGPRVDLSFCSIDVLAVCTLYASH